MTVQIGQSPALSVLKRFCGIAWRFVAVLNLYCPLGWKGLQLTLLWHACSSCFKYTWLGEECGLCETQILELFWKSNAFISKDHQGQENLYAVARKGGKNNDRFFWMRVEPRGCSLFPALWCKSELWCNQGAALFCIISLISRITKKCICWETPGISGWCPSTQ